MRNIENFYSGTIKAYELKLKSIRKESDRIAVYRLVIAGIMAGCIYGSFAIDTYFALLGLLSLAVFLHFVKRSAKLNHEISLLEQIKLLNQCELEFFHGKKTVFDTGKDYDFSDHLYAADLDIFGMGSLFQSVNRSTTVEGRKMLIGKLLHPPAQIEMISQRTEAIIELEELTEWRQRFFAIGSTSGETETDAEDFKIWSEQSDFYQNRRSMLVMAVIMSSLSSIFIAYTLYTWKLTFMYLIMLLIVNAFIFSFFTKSTKEYFKQFGRRTRWFEKLGELFDHLSSKEFTSRRCADIKSRAKEAATAFMELSKIANAADQRLNGLMGPLMNVLFFYDAWSIRRIERWRKSHKDQIDDWIQALAEMDMLNSMGNFSFNHPGYCRAIIITGKNQIISEELGHPLMSASIKNNYTIGTQSKAHVITGSNMAGKSTFIRAVGLNVVLALNGLPVCARSFSCSIMQVVACIRITDSLEDDASYFKAELTRLQKITHLLKHGQPCLVLLDEIMRGTNSDDKRSGTMAFFRKLKNYQSLSLLATHDLEIGKLHSESPEYFENFCFESTVSGEALAFDYKLRPGISTSTNATFLMRQLGLID